MLCSSCRCGWTVSSAHLRTTLRCNSKCTIASKSVKTFVFDNFQQLGLLSNGKRISTWSSENVQPIALLAHSRLLCSLLLSFLICSSSQWDASVSAAVTGLQFACQASINYDTAGRTDNGRHSALATVSVFGRLLPHIFVAYRHNHCVIAFCLLG